MSLFCYNPVFLLIANSTSSAFDKLIDFSFGSEDFRNNFKSSNGFPTNAISLNFDSSIIGNVLNLLYSSDSLFKDTIDPGYFMKFIDSSSFLLKFKSSKCGRYREFNYFN